MKTADSVREVLSHQHVPLNKSYLPAPAPGPFGSAALPDTEPVAGDGELDWVVPTLRICARTWDSCLSYSHAACCSRNWSVTSKLSALLLLALAVPVIQTGVVQCFPCPH